MSATKRLTVLVVDDEAPARQKLVRYLDGNQDFVVVGEARNGLEAVERIERLAPDVVLLDIEMPGLGGFEVIDALEVDAYPHVIFVTAHDEHALRAFEVRALDYLLKPVDRERLLDALDRVPRTPGAPQDLEGLASPSGGAASVDRFLVRERGRLLLIAAEDVDWIGAAGNYLELHTGTTVHLIRGTMTDLIERLPRTRFTRIHRSTIVNLDRVAAMHPWSHGDVQVVLKDGTELKMSRRFRDHLGGVFGG